MKVLIIGGVAGGAAAAARLRRLDEQAELIILERGEYVSFANCGLPYHIGKVIKDKSALSVQTAKGFKEKLNIDVRINSEAIRIDIKNKYVTIKCEDKEYNETYDKLIIATGAEPILPPIRGAINKRVMSLRTIPDMERIIEFIENNAPRSAAVIGGGYIGIEMAENIHALGLKVSIIEMADHVIAPLDTDMAAEVHNHIRSKGINLILKNAVRSIDDNENGLTVNLDNGNISADLVIMSIGVKPESSIAKEAGLSVNLRGSIIVNESMQTSDEDIYAVGDAAEVKDLITHNPVFVPLAGPAAKQGRVAADNLAGVPSIYTYTQGTAILKCFDMTVACTGINETVATTNKIAYEKSIIYTPSHASYYPGASTLCIKILFSIPDGRLLGAQITGFEGVDKRIDVFATAIRAEMTVKDLTRLELAYAPPYSSAKDPVNMAGFVAENILSNRVKVFNHSELDSLDTSKVTILDVRTEIEREVTQYPRAIHIPLKELRARYIELDKSKPVYLVCQTGLMSYHASRILTDKGYECYNLSGGLRMYRSNNQEIDLPVMVNADPLEKNNQCNIEINACGLQCPGPIMKLAQAIKEAKEGDIIKISTTDPAFGADVKGWCQRTNNTFVGVNDDKGITVATLIKGAPRSKVIGSDNNVREGKNIIVFSGDLDKAIASFIIANAAASMDRKVSMFFTFWGLNILRRPDKVKVKKDIMSRMFGMMMPRGSKKLGLSKMNMGGMGAKMIRGIMNKKNVDSLEDLIKLSIENGVELIACSMSMDVMGIKKEELIEGVKLGGAAAMLAHAEQSDMSLFI